ncbi:hypothetical protein AOQ84DRAFT_383242 [Glonium stellatum]|uniref:Uncharacterized protein n=1 Tax=Glonium stellatum TaxID=574774 RepID=A0A8E2ENB9_9PEZI|nr:hypothetical protein AOQ84DRAFT_383242 [Glonium stellatum]
MDEAYARSTGLLIDTRNQHRVRVKFANNSAAYTSGMAYGVEWRFGRDSESTLPDLLGFHIFHNTPANVILCDTFLYDSRAFSQYQHYLVDDDDGYQRIQTTAAAPSIADLRYFELVRQGEEEDRICNLLVGEQVAAWNEENQRRVQCEQKLKALQASQVQTLQPPPATVASQHHSVGSSESHATTSQNSSATISQGSSPGLSSQKRHRWRIKLKRGQSTSGTITTGASVYDRVGRAFRLPT